MQKKPLVRIRTLSCGLAAAGSLLLLTNGCGNKEASDEAGPSATAGTTSATPSGTATTPPGPGGASNNGGVSKPPPGAASNPNVSEAGRRYLQGR